MATFSDSHTKQLQKLLTCSICSNRYQDPRCLPCSHTFCLQCIEKEVKNGCFNCPSNDDMRIDQKNIAQLPINRTAKDMIEFVLSINLSPDNNSDHQCDNCTENQAINWCEDCRSYYCETCTESIHSNKRFQSDTIVPLRERIQSFCTDHSSEKVKFWCKKCEILVCRDCLLYQHKYHTYSSLEDAAIEAKIKFHETAQEIDEIKRTLTTCLEATKRIINQQRKVARQEKQDVEQMFDNLQYKLEERKLLMVKQLEENDLQTTNILNRQRVTINQHLNLTTVQEICIKRMLDSTDPMQILKLKSALYRNYHVFVEKYNKIDDGYLIKTHLVKKYEKDVEEILQMISKLGHINSRTWMIKGDNITIKTSSLDISKVGGDTGFITKENNYAHGYKFTLRKPLKLQSIQIHSDQVGQITGFVLNDADVIIHKGTITSINATMKWLRIPIECDVLNNYSLLVVTLSDNGTYTYKIGDNQPRMINQNCFVENKSIQSITQINLGSKIIMDNNSFSIDMMLDVEG